MRLGRQILHLLLPKLCHLCGRRTVSKPICSRCLLSPVLHCWGCIRCGSNPTDLDTDGVCHLCRLYPPIFERLIFMWDYSGVARELIRIAKYSPSQSTCRSLGGQLAQHLHNLGVAHQSDLIIPIPSSKGALFERGFNPCLVMAKEISATLNILLEPQALKHLGYRHRQASLKGTRRVRNVSRAFLARSTFVTDRSVLLIEDVVTTGATITAASAALIAAGARSVQVAALARTASVHRDFAELHRAVVKKNLLLNHKNTELTDFSNRP